MIIEVARWRSNAYSTTTMLNGEKMVVVMPAYNAARTLRQTYQEVMAHGIVDLVIVVDDASHDDTVAIARTLDRVQVEVHPVNLGYDANQKTCYRLALAAGAGIIIMIHPDYQYTPQLIPAMAALVASGLYPCVLASRTLGRGALRGGMPWWKYVANRFLTFVENLLGAKRAGSPYCSRDRQYEIPATTQNQLPADRLSRNVVATDPNAPAPMPWAPDIIGPAGPITRTTSIIWPIANRDRDGAWVSRISWTVAWPIRAITSVIWAAVRWVRSSGVVVSATGHTHRD